MQMITSVLVAIWDIFFPETKLKGYIDTVKDKLLIEEK